MTSPLRNLLDMSDLEHSHSSYVYTYPQSYSFSIISCLSKWRYHPCSWVSGKPGCHPGLPFLLHPHHQMFTSLSCWTDLESVFLSPYNTKQLWSGLEQKFPDRSPASHFHPLPILSPFGRLSDLWKWNSENEIQYSSALNPLAASHQEATFRFMITHMCSFCKGRK